MKKSLLFVIPVLSLLLVAAVAQVYLNDGDMVRCTENKVLRFDRPNDRQAIVRCSGNTTPVPTATATALPTNTPTAVPTSLPPTLTPAPTVVASMLSWHTPGAHDGLNIHEHGDAPPTWAEQWSVQTFGHSILYGGDEASSPMENTHKHQAFKGYTMASGNGVVLYIRYHAASNPADRAAAFHSYEVYAKDAQGGISFWQGHYFAGWPNEPTHRATRSQEQSGSLGANWPGRDQFGVHTPDLTDWQKSLRCEQWYTFGGHHAWSLGITICGATTLRTSTPGTEAGDPMNMDSWIMPPEAGAGLRRRMEASHYGPDNPYIRENQTPRGVWYCVQKVPVSPEVTEYQKYPYWIIGGTVATPNNCPSGQLPQFTATTFPRVGVYFEVGNTEDKDFPGQGVTLPN